MSVSRNPNFSSSPMRARKRRLFFVRFYIILFFLLIIIFCLAILSGQEKVKVKTVVISGSATTTSGEVLSIVQRDMTGRYFQLFSKSDSLIFPRFQIKTDLLEEIKTVKDVDISWAGWQKISLVLFERKPHSVWCGFDPKVTDSKCFLVDEEGYIYGPSFFSFSGNIFIKDYGQLASGQPNNASNINPIGSYFLFPETYSQIFNLINTLEQNNLEVVSMSFDGFDFRFILGIGPTIIFNDKNSFALSFGNLFSAIETKNLDLTKDASSISYIDLRFDNKIVVGKKGTQP